MIWTLLVYLLCAVTGFHVTRILSLNSLFSRAFLVFTVGAAQLMVSIEALSLCKTLTNVLLLPAHLLLTLLSAPITRKLPRPDRQIPWATLLRCVAAELKPS